MSDYWPAPDLPLFRQMAPAQQHSRTSMAAADSLDEDASTACSGKCSR
jgi:hypothetical protein